MPTQDGLVDKECKLKNVEVLHSYKGEPYGCTLSFCDLNSNTNKYYIIKILKSDGEYFLYTKSDRIGQPGNITCESYGKNCKRVIYDFLNLFRVKTFRKWGDKRSFLPRKGKYHRIKMSEEIIDEIEIHREDSNIEKKVAELIEMISDFQSHLRVFSNFSIYAEKTPLGKINNFHISNGYKTLYRINETISAIKSGVWERSRKDLNLSEDYIQEYLTSLSNEFWNNIPQDFGMEKPPLINTFEQTCKLSEMLEFIRNIKLTEKIVRKFNKVEDIYSELDIKIDIVKDPRERSIIHGFIKGTCGKTHDTNFKVLELFRLTKEVLDPENVFNSAKDHRLLAHGSRMINYMGILSFGLQIPLVNQITNGSALGNGIYFTDVITKAINYCYIDSEDNNIGLVLLCEVAIGENPDFRETRISMEEEFKYSERSRVALGKNTILNKHYKELTTKDGFVNKLRVPQGPLTPRFGLSSKSSFIYNEYTIYDVRKYRFRYMVMIKRN